MTTTLAPTGDTMRAVVKSGPGPTAVTVSTVPIPTTPPGFARLEVQATGICGTDVHIAHDEYGHEAPVVMGHEILGRVVQVGADDDREWVGRLVACETYFSACEVCDMCRAGRRNLCARRRSLGSYESGGFAEFVVLPVLNLHEIPDGLGSLDGALAEPLACVAQCLLDPAVVQAGDRVLVTGPGAMGQLAAQVARAQGGRVILAGLPRDSERLAVAAGFGIETTTEQVRADAFDVVIECSGSAAGAAAAFRAARPGARYVQVGIFGRDVSVPLDAVLYKELTLSSGFASTPTSWRHAMALLAQRLVVTAPLVTREVSLEDFDAALAAAQAGEGIKTVVVPARRDA